jgi:hypothetical protein
MAVAENQPLGIFPLEALRDTKPHEQDGSLYRRKGGETVNQESVRVTIEAEKKAIESGDGSVSIKFEIGDPSQRREETWVVMSNIHQPEDAKHHTPDIPVLDLYLRGVTGTPLLLPPVPEPTKIARIYPDRTQLFSKHNDTFNSSDVTSVLATIKRITIAVSTSLPQQPLTPAT